jgi:hypothetical protein
MSQVRKLRSPLAERTELNRTLFSAILDTRLGIERSLAGGAERKFGVSSASPFPLPVGQACRKNFKLES